MKTKPFSNRYNPFHRIAGGDIPIIKSTLVLIDNKLDNHESWQSELAFTLGKENVTVQCFAHGLYNLKGEILLKVLSILDITEQTKYKKLLEDYSGQLNELSTKLLDIQESERAKIARELHDDIGQQLTLLKFCISSDKSLSNKSALFRTAWKNLLQSVRSLSRQLRPAILDELGLPSAIQWFCQAARRHHSKGHGQHRGTLFKNPSPY